MLFTTRDGLVDTTGFSKLEVGSCTWYYSGFFWVRGHRAGADSIEAFAREYEATGWLPFRKAFGAFSCAVVGPGGVATFFTDNSNMRCMYTGATAISDSFLALVHHEHPAEFDDEALCEFLALGGAFFGKTLARGLSTTAHDTVYVISDGVIRSEPKGIGDLADPSAVEDLSAFFQDMAYALSGERVTLSLTGGYDSRLVLAGIKDALPVDVFISCSDDREPDVYWARHAAEAAGLSLEIVRVGKPTISEPYLRELFEETDGNAIAIDESSMRIHAFMHDRRQRGYTCYLTGDGGVRHKDWYWLQDLPFYRWPHTNIGRFYDQRIQVIRTPVPYGPRLEDHGRRLRRRMTRRMRRWVRPINTESYDAMGFHVQGDLVKVKYTARSSLLQSYAPLWELELVRYSFHLPRKQRFFNYSMRKATTRASPPLAKTPTVYGTTASSEPRYLARDVYFQAVDYARKAVRLVGRSLLHRNLLVGRPNTWSAEPDVRSLELSSRALAYSVGAGMVDARADPHAIPYEVLCRLIGVYLLAEAMNGSQGGRAAIRDHEELVAPPG